MTKREKRICELLLVENDIIPTKHNIDKYINNGMIADTVDDKGNKLLSFNDGKNIMYIDMQSFKKCIVHNTIKAEAI